MTRSHDGITPVPGTPHDRAMRKIDDTVRAQRSRTALENLDSQLGLTEVRGEGKVIRDWQDLRLPVEAAERKALPVCTGVLDYFPDALVAVAEVSRVGNDQHNPGQPLHWDKSKSTDHADSLVRHLLERGELDADGVRHSAKVAWRALALLQMEIEDVRA
jgi:hypothetical protein